MSTKSQVMYFNLGGKRLRVSVEEVDPISDVPKPGTIVAVECETSIVNDEDSDEEDVPQKYPAVLLSTHDDKATICWLLDTSQTDIKLPKSRWPQHWKPSNTFVLDTVYESVNLAAVKKHPNPDRMSIASRCYNSEQNLVAKSTYTAFVVDKITELNK